MKDIPEDETPFGGLEAPGHGHDGSAQHQSQHAHHHPASKMPPLNGISLMSVEDAETALQLARKETEKLEKGLNQVIKRKPSAAAPGRRTMTSRGECGDGHCHGSFPRSGGVGARQYGAEREPAEGCVTD